MGKILITTFYHYGIEKNIVETDDPQKWIKKEYPNADKIDEHTFNDYDSDSTIEII